MPGAKIIDYLNSNNVDFEYINHPREFSATRTCQSAHISGKEFAKTVILKIDGRLVMGVVSANQMIYPGYLKNFYSANKVELASETEFKTRFPDCEIGAMPPFGNLYDMEEFVSMDLAKDKYITFNAGTHTECIRMKYKDFQKLTHPKIINLEYHW